MYSVEACFINLRVIVDPNSEDKNKSRKWSFSMRFVLAGTFGALVALSVGTILFMSVDSNLNNTFSLLNERAETLISSMENDIKRETERTELTVRTFASLYENGTITELDRENVEPVMRTILSTEPAVEALMVYKTDGTWIDLSRNPRGEIGTFNRNWLSENAKSSFETQLTGDFEKPKWGQPVRIGPILFHFVYLPLNRDGETQGYILAAVGRFVINRLIAEIGRTNDTTAFVLDENNNVIAYSKNPQLLRGRPSYPLSE
ncbi:MAG: cache domain-containing protein, partial [Rhizobiaceae bacterium]